MACNAIGSLVEWDRSPVRHTRSDLIMLWWSSKYLHDGVCTCTKRSWVPNRSKMIEQCLLPNSKKLAGIRCLKNYKSILRKRWVICCRLVQLTFNVKWGNFFFLYIGLEVVRAPMVDCTKSASSFSRKVWCVVLSVAKRGGVIRRLSSPNSLWHACKSNSTKATRCKDGLWFTRTIQA